MSFLLLQNKENRGLVERLTSLASTHSQSLDKLHSLEAQLEKSTHLKVSVEAKEKKAREEASVVSLASLKFIHEDDFQSFSSSSSSSL